MVFGYALDHFFGFVPLLHKVGADRGMRTLYFTVDRFADIVQQSGALCQGYIYSQLGSYHAREIGHLDTVSQHVLTVAGAVFKPPQELDKLGVQPGDTDL